MSAEDGLRFIARNGCENFWTPIGPGLGPMHPAPFKCIGYGMTIDAEYGADLACYPCIANEFLAALPEKESQ